MLGAGSLVLAIRSARRPLTHVVFVMLGMIRVQRMVGGVGVFGLSALVVMAVVVMPVLAVLVLVAVMSLAVMNIVRGILIYGGRSGSAAWSSWCRA